jgi:hypothetical protein
VFYFLFQLNFLELFFFFFGVLFSVLVKLLTPFFFFFDGFCFLCQLNCFRAQGGGSLGGWSDVATDCPHS